MVWPGDFIGAHDDGNTPPADMVPLLIVPVHPIEKVIVTIRDTGQRETMPPDDSTGTAPETAVNLVCFLLKGGTSTGALVEMPEHFRANGWNCKPDDRANC